MANVEPARLMSVGLLVPPPGPGPVPPPVLIEDASRPMPM
jgi:hypothetical protein